MHSAASRRWRRHLLAIGFFTLATVVMTWPQALRMPTHLQHRVENDDILLCTWTLGWGAERPMALDFAHLFDGNIFYPAPYALTYSDHLLGYQPIVLPVYALTGNLILAHNVAFLLTFVLVGYFTYLLVRHLTASDAAGVFAGLALAFVPFRFQHWHHISLQGFEWIPLALLALHRLLEGSGVRGQGSGRTATETPNTEIPVSPRPRVPASLNSPTDSWLSADPRPLTPDPSSQSAIRNPQSAILWGLLAGVAISMQMLTGMYQGAYLCLLAGLLVLVLAPATGAYRRGSFWLAAAVAALIFVATNGPILAVYARAHRALGLARSEPYIQAGAATMTDYLRINALNRVLPALGVRVPPNRTEQVPVGNALTGRTTLAVEMPGDRDEPTCWLGAVVVMHAGFGFVVLMRRRRDRRVARATAALYLGAALLFFLSLGPVMETRPGRAIGRGPYSLLVRYVPGFSTMRQPTRLCLMVSVYLTVLAGYGFAAVFRRFRRRAGRAVYASAACGLMLAEFWSAPLPTVRIPLDADTRDLCQYLAERPGERIVAHFPSRVPLRIENKPEYHMYLSTIHRQRLIDGNSGNTPPIYRYIRPALHDFPAATAVDVLQALGATDVVVDTSTRTFRITPDLVTDTRLVAVKRFGRYVVYAVAGARRDWRQALAAGDVLQVPATAPAGAVLYGAFDLSDRASLGVLTAPFTEWRTEWALPGGAAISSRLVLGRYDERTGDSLPLTLRIPAEVGEYEFRLVDAGGGVLARRPVRVVAPAGYWTGADDAAPRAAVTLAAPLPARTPPGRPIRVRLRIQNLGRAAWACRPADEDIPGRPDDVIRVGWHVAGPDAKPVASGRWFLPCDVAPGQTVSLSVTLEAPDVRGACQLTVDPTIGGGGWFSRRGSTPLRAPLTIGP